MQSKVRVPNYPKFPYIAKYRSLNVGNALKLPILTLQLEEGDINAKYYVISRESNSSLNYKVCKVKERIAVTKI